MALPIIHLLVAHAWADGKEAYVENPSYYLGSIAPDAIHMREGTTRLHKTIMHLGIWDDWDSSRVTTYWAERMNPFDIGYGLHVLTDFAWTRFYHDTYPALLNEKGKTIPSLYYKDCDMIDNRLRKTHPLIPKIWDMLGKADPPSNHPLLSIDEIHRWTERVLSFYDAMPDDWPPEIITLEGVIDFVKRSPVEMRKMLVIDD